MWRDLSVSSPGFTPWPSPSVFNEFSTDIAAICAPIWCQNAHTYSYIIIYIYGVACWKFLAGRGQYDDRWRFRRWSCIVLQANSAPVCLRCGHLLLLPGCSDSCHNCHNPCHVFTTSPVSALCFTLPKSCWPKVYVCCLATSHCQSPAPQFSFIGLKFAEALQTGWSEAVPSNWRGSQCSQVLWSS